MSNEVDSAIAEPESPGSSRPTERHRALEVLVGSWNTTGEIVGEGGRLQAVDTYEWLPGRFFLVHHVDGELGGQEIRALEVIGYNADRGDYFTRSFDNGGRAAAYRARLDGNSWSIDGETERFRGEFSKDHRALRGLWEQRSDNGAWRPWMRIELTKSR